MQPNDKIEQQNAAIANLVLEVAAEKQRADMLLEQGKLAEAQVQAEQQRYESLAQEMARKIGQLQEVLRATDIEISYRQDGTLDWKRVSPIPAQTGMVSVTAAELSCVINWLEGGRDPKDAAKELRMYCERAWTGTQPVQQPASAGAVHQFRTSGTSDWYDGHPDNEDGGAPYEVRILYAAPVAAPVAMPAASVPDAGDANGRYGEILFQLSAEKVEEWKASMASQPITETGSLNPLCTRPQPAPDVAQVGEEQIITQRDAFRDVADNLANAIAAHFGVDIGEHSSVNCPWDEALRVIEEAGQVGELSDAQIIEALHSLGIDTYPSKYGFPEVQVSATTVPTIRKIAEILAAAKKGG